jgi:hypothetical protein
MRRTAWEAAEAAGWQARTVKRLLQKPKQGTHPKRDITRETQDKVSYCAFSEIQKKKLKMTTTTKKENDLDALHLSKVIEVRYLDT